MVFCFMKTFFFLEGRYFVKSSKLFLFFEWRRFFNPTSSREKCRPAMSSPTLVSTSNGSSYRLLLSNLKLLTEPSLDILWENAYGGVSNYLPLPLPLLTLSSFLCIAPNIYTFSFSNPSPPSVVAFSSGSIMVVL